MLKELQREAGSMGPTIRDLRSIIYSAYIPERLHPLLQAFAPDVLYERMSLFGVAGTKIAERLHIPHILEVNAPLCDEHAAHRGMRFSSTARDAEQDVLRSADHVVTVSKTLSRWAVRSGVSPERVVVMSNAVDPQRFAVASASDERAGIKRQLGIPDDSGPVIGFVGTLKDWHDVPTLIHAAAKLKEDHVKAHVLIVGDGPRRAELEGLAAEVGLSDSTTFTGAVEHDAVPSLLGAMDVAVAPYPALDDFYFSPLKLFEYMAAGIPAIASRVGDIPATIHEGETGWLYTPGDALDLAGALGAVISAPEQAAAIAQRGRNFVRSEHTWLGNARKVCDLVATQPHQAHVALERSA